MIENVKAIATKAAGVIVGLPEKPLERIVLRNVKITVPKSLEVRNAKVEIR